MQGSDKKKKKGSKEVPFVQGKKALTDAKGNKTGFYQTTTTKVVKQRPKSHKGGK